LFYRFNRSSHNPARCDELTGNYFLTYGKRNIALAFVTGIQLPSILIMAMAPVIFSYTIYALYFVIIILASIWSGFKIYLRIYFYYIELTEENIIEKRILFKRRIIPWKNICRVSCDRRSIGIRTIDGVKLTISNRMDGFITLPDVMLPKLYPSVAKKASETLCNMGLRPNQQLKLTVGARVR